MSKNKILLFAGGVLVLIIILVLAIIALRKRTNTAVIPNTPPSTYSATVNLTGGSFSVFLNYQNNQFKLGDAQTAMFLPTSFNRTHDILHIYCPDNYIATDVQFSPKDLKISTSPELGSDLVLDQSTTGQITTTCTKK